MQEKNFTNNQRFSESQLRNRIFLGLTTLGISLGVIGTLSSHSANKTFSRTSLTKTSNKSLLSTNSKGLRTTVDPTTLFLGAVGAGAGVAGAIIAGLDYSQSKASSQQQAKQLDGMNKRLDSMDGRLANLERDSAEIKRLLKENNELQEELKNIHQGTQDVLKQILEALTKPKT